jgi:ferredoxin-type protein NapH
MNLQFSKLTLVRRCVQISVVVMMLGVPSLARYNNYLASHEIDFVMQRWEGTLQGQWLTAIDSTMRMMPGANVERAGKLQRDRDVILVNGQQIRGGPWSAQFGPVSMTDPLAFFESAIARKHISTVLFLGAILPILITLIFGRVFCSWICPVGFFLELTDKLRGLVALLEIKSLNVRFKTRTKYVVLGIGLLVALLGSVPVLGYIYPPAIAGREFHSLVFGLFDRAESGRFGWSVEGFSWVIWVLVAIAAFEVLISRRWWCRTVCPGGALYALMGSERRVRVQLNEPNCTGCVACVQACPMSLNPMKGKIGQECDSCGLCVAACGDDALDYGFGRSDRS